MNSIHIALSEKFPLYKKWHEHPGYKLVHWSAFLILALGMFQTLSAASLAAININDQVAQVSKFSRVTNTKALDSLSRNADAVIAGVVSSHETRKETNDYGDEFLVTKVKVLVNQWLKGSTEQTIDLDMIGGTLDGYTMRSSVEPEPLADKEQAVIYLEKSTNGRYKISSGDTVDTKGLLLINSDGKAGGISFDEIRTSIKNTK